MNEFLAGGRKMRIIADTPTLYTPEEGRACGLTVIPACTIVGENVYRDYEDIGSEEFVKLLNEGATPTTSQPSIGDILDGYQSGGEEILAMPIGDGLSGTYQNMEGARNLVEDNGRIHVLNTKTLAGPQRYLVQKAMKLRDQGFDIEGIKRALQESIESSASFVIPVDFNFLKRSGRLTPVAAKVGTVLKIVPVLTQTEDKRRITLFSIKRSKKKAVAAIIDHFKSLGVDENYLITVCRGGGIGEARAVIEQMKEHFVNTAMEMFALAPSLVCHGGPGCILIQTIRK